MVARKTTAKAAAASKPATKAPAKAPAKAQAPANTKPTGKEVAKPTAAGLPAMADMEADAGMGGEEATSEDMVIPFLRVAQALSDEVNKREAAYIEGLDPGDFFNTATRDIYGGEAGLYLIPVLFQRKYLGWTPRSQGGGFRGEFKEDIMAETHTNEGENGTFLEDGTEIVPTGTWFCFIVDVETGAASQAVVSLSKTQLKKSRQLMTMLKSTRVPNGNGGSFNPPLFFHVLHVTSVPESNDQGNWFGWHFDIADINIFDLPNGPELYAEAKTFISNLRSGAVKAANPEATGGADGDMPF